MGKINKLYEYSYYNYDDEIRIDKYEIKKETKKMIFFNGFGSIDRINKDTLDNLRDFDNMYSLKNGKKTKELFKKQILKKYQDEVEAIQEELESMKKKVEKIKKIKI